MKPIIVKKEKLLEILKGNRDKHRQVFLEALDGYKKRVLEILEDALTRAKKGDRVRPYFQIIEPRDQTSDYDRVIGMLELTEDQTIELNENEYRMYVQDKWSWRHDFLTSNSQYSSTARTMAFEEGLGEESE